MNILLNKNYNSIEDQGITALRMMRELGRNSSKEEDKVRARDENGGKLIYKGSELQDKLYSDATLDSYTQAWKYYCSAMRKAGFICSSGHFPTNLQEAAEYLPTYINELVILSNQGVFSPWTVRGYFSGVAKVLGKSACEHALPKQSYHFTRKSHGDMKALIDKFKNHQDLITFCACTGLRHKTELLTATGRDLVMNDDQAYIHVERGKGGYSRISPIIGSDEEVALVIDMLDAAGGDLLFPQGTPSGIDINTLREEYASRVYLIHARDINELSRSDIIIFNGTEKYDRQACIEAGKALGHTCGNPYQVIAYYLR